VRWLAVAIAVSSPAPIAHAETHRTIAGSLQLDYLAVPTDRNAHTSTLDGLTAELSLKMSIDFTPSASATDKVCFACHGFEAAAAFVDLRAADELSVRVGRLTPELGSFPLRADPANHRTNDKPLPYDMGRMLHNLPWNEGILPAPWVDNGVELFGTRFVGGGRVDYAAYILSGPKGQVGASDFDFIASRSPGQYYVDNNSEPVVGARLSGTADLDSDGHGLTFGASFMTGRYDPDRQLGFLIAGADLVASLDGIVLRGEYLARRTDLTIGATPNARVDHFFKHGFYAEAEVPLGSVDAFARFDGLIRSGAVATDSALTANARLLRYTAGVAIRLSANIRLKSSIEYYQFSDFSDDLALHLGVATPF
jgi:hypothetical protein